MRLSEAIRLGAMLGPQCFGAGIRDLAIGTASCALGSAWLAVNKQSLTTVWPWLGDVVHWAGCPVCAHRQRQAITHIMVHLNDDHRWTRQAIADWVATVEPSVELPFPGVEPDVAQLVG